MFQRISVILFFQLIASAALFSQITNDTIILKQVDIRERYPSLPGINNIKVNDILLKENKLNDVSSAMQTLPCVFIKSSGPGSSSLAYIRGAGASHTNVTWNGILLNSSMTGQSDLSSIPAAFTDEIMLLTGNNSSFSHTPAIGGTLLLENRPVWEDQNNLNLAISGGSFGNYSGSLALSKGNKRIFSRLRLYGKNESNRFPYLNNAVLPNETMFRENAGTEHGSVQHELFYRKGTNLFSLVTWTGSISRDIPALMTNVNSAKHEETQKDRFIRISGAAEWNRDKISFYIKPGFSVSDLNYKLVHITSAGSLTSAESRSSDQLINSNQGVIIRYKKTIIRAGNSTSFSYARVSDLKYDIGYFHKRAETVNNVNFEQPIGRYFRILASAMSGWTDISRIPILPSLHVYFRPVKNNLPVIYLSAGKNFRTPSLNDLYFIPGGNPELKNERSVSYEAGMEDCIFKLAGSCFNLNTSVFYQEIYDWILWQPSQFGYWSPFNIRNAVSAGFSCTANWTKEIRNGSISFISKYTFNSAHANDNSYETVQTVYLPIHNAFSQMSVLYGKWRFSTNAQYMSERKTSIYTNTWSPDLKPVWIQNLSISRRFIVSKSKFDIAVKSDNIFNTQWQQVLWRPMPGRSFLISVNFEI